MIISRLTMPGALAALALLLAQDVLAADSWCYRKLGDSSDKPCGGAVAALEYCLRLQPRARLRRPERRAGAIASSQAPRKDEGSLGLVTAASIARRPRLPAENLP
jgi:hypothetical protein